MFEIQDFNQEDDQKPPSFFHPTDKRKLKNATKLIQAKVKFHYNNDQLIDAALILYEDFLVAQVENKFYMIETDLTLAFEIPADQKTIIFIDNQREISVTVRFNIQKDAFNFYQHIKKSLFQIGFHQKYEIQEKIGSGKTSFVYKIQNKFDGKVYAAKFYSNIPSSIEKQLKILRVLEHPNLIYFHEIFIENCQIYIIMDYQDGGTLLDIINQDSFLTIKEKIGFLLDMLNAFEFLRIKNIVHRDLKPENILYSKRQNSFKIADFQLAIQENEPITRLIGTPGYLAPQFFETEKTILANHYSDIYSLGLIYFEIATKKAFFQGESAQSIFKDNEKAMSLKKRKYSKDQITDAQYDILRMMIRKDPEDRSLSLEILQSTELRNLIKQHMIEKNSSISSQNKNSKSSNSDSEQSSKEDNIIGTMKKMFRLRRLSN